MSENNQWLHDEIATLRSQLAEANEKLEASIQKADGYERQLVCISKMLGGKDARHVSPEYEASIAGLVEEQLAASQARVERLKGALRDAREDVQEWGAYAMDYFQEKYNLQGCLDRIDSVLNAESEASDGP